MKLWHYLPERRARRRPRHAPRRHGRRSSPEISILHRPDIVRERKQLGHWECDLLQLRKKFGTANVTSLVERVSRFTVFLRNNDRQSKPIMDGPIDTLSALPHSARRSITFDRGTEFTDWPLLQAGLGVQTWFCDHSHRDRKDRSKTPIAVPANGCCTTLIRCRSATAT